MSLFKVLEAIKLTFGQGDSRGILVTLIEVYNIISLNAFCDLSYTRNILPRESAGTISKELGWPSAQISPLLPCLSQTPGTETVYPHLDERCSGMQLMFSALPEDLRPSLFYRFGI